jgi:hypothetical protein
MRKINNHKRQTAISLLLSLILYVTTYGQITFQEHLITSDVFSPTDVFPADFDGDGFIDILYNSEITDIIAWQKNTNGSFGPQIIISSAVDHPLAICAADIDGDGDLDALSSSDYDTKIAWYKNLDGAGTFGSQQIITSQAGHKKSISAADIDGDGDLDVIFAGEDIIAWCENQDGQGVNFSPQTYIYNDTGHGGFYELCMVDIDNDNDLDILTSGKEIAWFKNDGSGNFGSKIIITGPVGIFESVFASDLDGDGDLDVLSANYDNNVAWYENTDGTGTFGAPQSIATNATHAHSIYAADIDGDNDMDVLVASDSDHKVVWYENTDGLGEFSYDHIITTNASQPHSVCAFDVNNDGNQDVVVALSYDNKIYWYENEGNLSINQNNLFISSIYPNPTSGILNIDSQTSIAHISVYNHLGQIVLEKKGTYQLDISRLNQGIYFVKTRGINGSIRINKIVKK